jgi:transcriptional regulator with XRE-family HTH domain
VGSIVGPLDLVGPALALVRERKGLTLEEAAGRIGIDTSGVRKQERKDANPQADTLSRYLQKLGADAHDLAAALDEVSGREVRCRARREPSPTAMAMAMEELPATVSAEDLREWAALYEEERAAWLARQTLRRRLLSTTT